MAERGGEEVLGLGSQGCSGYTDGRSCEHCCPPGEPLVSIMLSVCRRQQLCLGKGPHRGHWGIKDKKDRREKGERQNNLVYVQHPIYNPPASLHLPRCNHRPLMAGSRVGESSTQGDNLCERAASKHSPAGSPAPLKDTVLGN